MREFTASVLTLVYMATVRNNIGMHGRDSIESNPEGMDNSLSDVRQLP